jgi:hypothetical protein
MTKKKNKKNEKTGSSREQILADGCPNMEHSLRCKGHFWSFLNKGHPTNLNSRQLRCIAHN